MDNQIERLIKLAQKTGDTLIISGDTLADSIVVMSIDKYEKLVLAEKSKKVTNEATKDTNKGQENVKSKDIKNIVKTEVVVAKKKVEDSEKIKEVEINDVDLSMKQGVTRKEVLMEESVEEDQFYLEPID